jgi:hypothetical protein
MTTTTAVLLAILAALLFVLAGEIRRRSLRRVRRPGPPKRFSE